MVSSRSRSLQLRTDGLSTQAVSNNFFLKSLVGLGEWKNPKEQHLEEDKGLGGSPRQTDPQISGGPRLFVQDRGISVLGSRVEKRSNMFQEMCHSFKCVCAECTCVPYMHANHRGHKRVMDPLALEFMC